MQNPHSKEWGLFLFMTKQLRISQDQFSTAGRKTVNQDCHGIIIPEEPQLTSKGICAVIADGISSSQVSHIASEATVQGFLSDYYCTSDSWSTKKSGQRVLEAINSWLFAQTQYSPHKYNKDKGYVCTFSAIIFKSNTAHIFHCGDARIYRLANGGLEQLTQDHRRVISSEESYLAKALGINNFLDLDYLMVDVTEGDFFLLATDGVYEFIDDKLLIQTIIEHRNHLSGLAENIIQKALNAGSDDNLTLQIIRIDELPEQNLGEIHRQVNQLPPPPQLGPRMEFEGYKIIKDVYISSRSHVFLAEDIETQQQVILKTPSAEKRDDPAYLENLLMEDWIAKRLNNLHILKAVESSRKQNYLYTLSEYIEGRTLAQWMLDNPKPDLETVRSIVEQVAKGLQAFHRQEMVHQDLRPNNIMIDRDGVVKIIDFGSTKVAGISDIVQRNEGIVGTAQYTAPEYYLGYLGTSRSDIFSLGVITYQMLSGELPYGNAIARSTDARTQLRLRYKSLATDENAIPSWVDFAIKKAVNINPLKRYDEVSEFIYELRHPNADFIKREKPPLIERNPVLFWQVVSFILFAINVYFIVRNI
ncbi:bifunctional protein-serine/threonine kinase/phosphatase [Sessilibacter sp. MAH4]